MLGRREIFADIRRLPELYGVMLLWIILRLEADELSAVKQRRPVTDDRRIHLLLDQVIPEQDVHTRLGVVEDVEVVFAVWRSDRALYRFAGSAGH